MNEVAMWFGYFMLAFYAVVGWVLGTGWLCGVVYKKFLDQNKFMRVLMKMNKEKP